MYEAHFGMQGRPFDGGIAQDLDVFRGRPQETLIAKFKQALAVPDSVVVLTGPAGVGKTTLTSAALRATSTRLALAWLNAVPTNATELLELLLVELGVNAHRTTRIERLQMWRQTLSELSATDSRVFVIAEHTEDLAPDVLRALDSLTAADASGSPGANVVLLGRPGLEQLLAQPAYDSLRQRIRLRQKLAPFGAEELTDYLRHRVTSAGGNFERVFASGAAAAVHRYSGGLARVANNLCEAALGVAAAEGKPWLTGELIARVAVDLLGLGEETPPAASAAPAANVAPPAPIATVTPAAPAAAGAPAAATDSRTAPIAAPVAPTVTFTSAAIDITPSKTTIPPAAIAITPPTIAVALPPVVPVAPRAAATLSAQQTPAPTAPAPQTTAAAAPVPATPRTPTSAPPKAMSLPPEMPDAHAAPPPPVARSAAPATPAVPPAPARPTPPVTQAAAPPPATRSIPSPLAQSAPIAAASTPRRAPPPAPVPHNDFDATATDIPDVASFDFPVLTDAVEEPSAPIARAPLPPASPVAAPTAPPAPSATPHAPAAPAQRPTTTRAAPPAPPKPQPEPKRAAAAPPAVAADVDGDPDALRQTQTMRAISLAKSIDDVSDSMAETLFGEAELDFLSAALASAVGEDEAAPAASAPASAPARATAPRAPTDDFMDLFNLGPDAPLELIDDSSTPEGDRPRKAAVRR